MAERGYGELTIADGASVISHTGGAVGGSQSSWFGQGVITVTGAGSNWHSNYGIIAYRDRDIVIDDGAAIFSDTGVAGVFSGRGLVTGDNSAWTHQGGNFVVGSYGGRTGHLTIADGGTVTATERLSIASLAGTTEHPTYGIIDVVGVGSSLVSTDTMRLGSGNAAAFATLTVADGGAVQGHNVQLRGGHVNQVPTATVALTGDLTIFPTGTVTLDGGTLAFDGYSNDGTFNFHAGGIALAGDRTIGDDDAITDLFGNHTFIPWYKTLDIAGETTVVNDLHVQASTTVGGSRVIGLRVGNATGGSMNIDNAATATVDGVFFVGHDAQAVGELDVRDAATLIVGSNLRVGLSDQADGTLSVLEASQLETLGNAFLGEAPDAVGRAILAGPGTHWDHKHAGGATLRVGVAGQGELTVVNGAKLTNAGGQYLAWSPGSHGLATISGAGAQWISSHALSVGNAGVGELVVEDGGYVSTGFSVLANTSTSQGFATITGPGSTWQITGSALSIGAAGSGELTVSHGGTVISNARLFVGGNPNGPGGPGTLNIDTDGQVHVGNTLHVWNAGQVNLAGGALDADALEHTDGGAFNFTAGTLAVGTFHGSLTQQGGTLAPGNSPGTTVITGDYDQQSNATLEIEIAGLSPSTQHDVLSVLGDAWLAGTIRFELLDGFLPQAGQQFAFLDVTSTLHVDQDLDIIVTNAPPSFEYELLATAAGLSLHAINDARHLLVGDMNADGTVDTGDVAPFVLALTDPTSYMAQFDVDEDTMIALGDINQDGSFDTGDVAPFVQLLVGGDASVPEPGSLALLGLGALMLVRRGRASHVVRPVMGGRPGAPVAGRRQRNRRSHRRQR